MDYIIACDLGTGGSKTLLYDENATVISSAFSPYATEYPRSGWHEQRPMDWWLGFMQSVEDLLSGSAVNPEEIRCLALSGHSLGVVPIGSGQSLLRTSTPIWSDTRATDQTAEFFKRIDEDEWYKATGNGFARECYTVFKVMWYRDNEPEMFARAQKIIGTKDFINMLLTGKIATDYSYASGTGVYDLRARRYDGEFIRAAGLSEDLFPKILPSTQVLGGLTKKASDATGLPRSVQVICGGVDNSCIALGAGNTREGKVYISLGSSAWIAVTSARPVLDAAIRPFAFDHVIPDAYTSAFGVFSAGSAFNWLRTTVCVDLEAESRRNNTDVFDVMVDRAKRSVPGSHHLIFNPSLAGGSGAHPSANIRGGYLGLDLSHTRADLINAVLEGVAFELRMMFEKIEQLCDIEGEVILVGGGGKSAYWQDVIANVLVRDIVNTKIVQDAGCLGAAAIAAVGAGIWEDFRRIDLILAPQWTAKPNHDRSDVYEKMFAAYKRGTVFLSDLGDALADMDTMLGG